MRRFAAGLGLALLGFGAAPLAAQTTQVIVTPVGYTTGHGVTVVNVKIAWCGYPPWQSNIDINTRVITVNGVDVTGNFDLQWDQAACGFQGAVSDEQLWSSSGTISVDEAAGPMTLYAGVQNSFGGNWAVMESYYPPKPRLAVSVTAQQQYLTVGLSEARTERFTVKNMGTVPDTFAITTLGCSGGAGSAIPGACTISGSPVALAAGASGTVTASYTASATTGKTALLWAKATSTKVVYGTAKDSAWTDITTKTAQAVGVVIVGTSPGVGDVAPRASCVTIALADDAAAECGDLRLVHSLPATRTMGTVRAPTLLYNSQHARPKPLVMADVRLSTSIALPDSVIACIKVAGTSRGCGRWAGSSWGAMGNTRRVVVMGDDGLPAAPDTAFTLEVTAKNGNQGPYTTTGRLFLVNRSGSRYGAGWWIAGLEQLARITTTEVVWIGGDGSSKRYIKTGSVWKTSNYADLDSIKAAGTGYVRYTAEQARVYFSAAGRHDSTINSLRHVTKFEYGGVTDSLLKIRVPKPGGWLDYVFAYASGKLDSVAAPGTRGVKLFRTSARVDSIRDADGNKVRFTSSTGLNQYIVLTRKDRRGNTTTFSYDAGNRISQSARPLSNTTVLAVAETKGLTVPVLLDSAFTQIDGPRSDVSDVSRLWINGYGAPVRTRNAMGQETLLKYNSAWPGLADSSVAPSRLVSRAWFNTRGLIDSTVVINPVGLGTNAVTRYKWHSVLNRTTSVRTWTGGSFWLLDSTSYNADSTMGWQQRGSGSSTRVNFYYGANLLPDSLVLPGPDKVTFWYSTDLGNPRKERSPSGALTLMFADAIGRDTLIVTPRGTGTEITDSTQLLAKGVRQRTQFDKMSRDTLGVTIGPQVTLPNTRVVPADTVLVRSVYDAEGNRTTATRSYTKKRDGTEGGLYQMDPSEWQYDALNRVTQQRDAGSGWTILTLDPAGNPTTTQTPRGKYITATFDALNRATQRVVPEVVYTSSACHYTFGGSCQYTFPILEGTSLCVPTDTLRFRYDAAGNLTAATNNWAKIYRGYAVNGAIVKDSLYTRDYETHAPDPTPCGGADKHAEAESVNFNDFGHMYIIGYEYDIAGRRTKLTNLPCGASCQLYKYNSTTGTLDTLVHPGAAGGTLTTRFAYDNQLRLLTTYHPGSVNTTLTYNSDGGIATRVGPNINDALTYDGGGRVISGTVWVPLASANRTLSHGYGGLGALQWSQGMTEGVTSEEYKTDALGNRLWVRDVSVIDGVDRARYETYNAATGQLTSMALGTPTCGAAGATQVSCHPAWYLYEYNQSHDASGNVDATWGKNTIADQSNFPEETRSYYGADEKLMYFNRHLGWSTPGQAQGVFEEYRYDALGRRVFARSRRPSSCAYPCEAYTQRTVWDGDQVLYDIRASSQAFYTEGDGMAGPGEDQNLFGVVLYAHGPGMDQPVGVLKRYDATNWAYLTPHTNWQGEWNHGSTSTGTLCLTSGTFCPNWPGDTQLADGGAQGGVPPTYVVWWGTLLQGTANSSGLQYLRNRYYDPHTGRFTQQDPIGLGGGLNLYGFAAGDPVNFGDPMGLCPGPLAIVCARAAAFFLGRVAPVLTELGAASTGLVAAGSFSRLVPGGGLAAHEAGMAVNGMRGHTLARHVGRTAVQLAERLTSEGLEVASTFKDRATAEAAITATLEANATRIGDAFAHGVKEFTASLQFTQSIGEILRRGAASVEAGYTATVLIRLDKGSSMGWYVHTAYVR